jgi:5-(carboxyamino)imidazole ribonucleotide synthase
MTGFKDTGQRIPPGSTIGILGGGQLGRMSAMAAAQLGYRCHIYCPDPESPAFDVAAQRTVAAYEDETALARFADSVDLVTLEFENIPARTAELLAGAKPLRPAPHVLAIAQDRLKEKDFLAGIGVPTTRYQEIARPESLERAVRDLGRPSILKSARFGYDGKGQVRIEADTDLDQAWRRMGGEIGILEAFVDFAIEASVVVARGVEGQMAAYPPVENQHRNHILDTTIAPARVSSAVAMRAEAIARHIAEELKLVGLLAVEMFVTPQGEVLVNELAPRPHNSGHWTLDACVTSQFEQFIRAVAGLPLGSPNAHSNAVMKNLLGDEVERWAEILAEPGAKLHLYGKREARPGRKMGHVTRLSPKRSPQRRG